ncbi:hypothetical protein [uncultured Microbulbifer sp.]|uniref:hypothetical protein n=1 Tax=uncultured Microbulbifer sp. TaxID=348147 RepID=UPI0025F74A5E|nr:hypothetical protein [uncultured Microbulbifer sp.]
MTSKELAYAVQQYLQSLISFQFKRAHIYELMAACYGFKSYASLGKDIVLSDCIRDDRQISQNGALLKARCLGLGCPADSADSCVSGLLDFLVQRQIGPVSISTLIGLLQAHSHIYGDYLDEDDEEFIQFEREGWPGPLLINSLEIAANKGNSEAHYALALIFAPSEYESRPVVGGSYWYEQRQMGRLLSGAEKEWADAYEARIARDEKYGLHLREAARLGDARARLDLAERFADPSFFEQNQFDIDADPIAVADIAKSLGRKADARDWLTLAAEQGDTDAMLELIEEHDHGDLKQCWIWMYLSQLVGSDLSQSDHYAINEDGSLYDDDIGGSMFVAGRDAVTLKPLDSEQDAAARRAAEALFDQIRES